MLEEQALDAIVVDKLQLDAKDANLAEWHAVVEARATPEAEVTIAMVGKYVDLKDSYISLTEALRHAGIQTRTRVNIFYVEASELEQDGVGQLTDVDAILVPGGFGDRGIEGKIRAVQLAREKGIPYLGICLGLQVAVIEFARNVVELGGAHSTEFSPATAHPVIALITEWQDASGAKQERSEQSDLGGTMRLGAQRCNLKAGTRAREIYANDSIYERHRHRYEFNNTYMEQLSQAGLEFSGLSDDGLVEVIELPSHPWFLACQFHPEFTSNPRDGHPLFTSFVSAARSCQGLKLPRASGE